MPSHSDPIMLAVGDVFLDRPDPAGAFQFVQSIFDHADGLFGNCEGVYARDREWERAPSSGVSVIADPRGIEGLRKAGFTSMSLANNHAVDGGFRAMLAMRDALEAVGIATAGAGQDVVGAHKPAITRRGENDVAMLAYTSAFAHGYEARCRVPGLAVVRAQTVYAPWEANEWYPGLLPRVATITDERDLVTLQQDIARAAELASAVIVSFHWGDHTRPFVITDHERRTARIAIDAGADAVLGHHHHLLRGFEYYSGKPIFYGLGHFAFDLPDWDSRLKAEGYLVGTDPHEARAIAGRFGDYSLSQRDGYPLLPFHPDARLTLIAGLELRGSGFVGAFVIPCLLGPNAAASRRWQLGARHQLPSPLLLGRRFGSGIDLGRC